MNYYDSIMINTKYIKLVCGTSSMGFKKGITQMCRMWKKNVWRSKWNRYV